MAYGSLVIKFAADLAELQKDVRRATTMMQREFQGAQQRINRALGAIGVGLGGAAFGALVKNAVDVQDQLYKMSQRVGASVESLSELRYAATLSDVSFENLGGSMAKLAKNMAEAQQDTGDAKDAFKALGIEVKNADGSLRSTDAVFGDVADAFRLMEDSAGKTAIAMKIFGRSGAELIPLLNQGRDGFKEMGEEARAFGVLVGTDAARAAEEFNDNLRRLGFVVEGLATALANSLLPGLNDWIKANLELIKVSGGVGQMLNLFVFDLEAMTTEKPVEQINRLNAELRELERLERARVSRTGLSQFVPVGNEDERRKKIETQIEGLKVLDRMQQEAGLRGTEFEGFDAAVARASKGVGGTRKAPEVVDSAKALAEAKKLQDLERKLADAAGSLAAARANAIAKEDQDLANERLKILEGFYSEGLIAEQEYWTTRLQIQQGALTSQLAAIDQEIARRQEAVSVAEKERLKTTEGATAYLKALQELEEAQAKRNDLERSFASVSVQNFLAARAAAIQYEDAIRDVNVRLLELQGRSAEASAISFAAQTKDLLRQAESRGDTAGADAIGRLGRATVAQARFNDVQRRAEIIQRDLSMQEERIRNSREVGAISEIRSLQETSEARRNSLAELEAIGREMQRVADESGNVFLVQQAQAFRLEIEKLAGQTDLLADRFDKIGETAFSDFLSDLLDGTKSVKDAFKDMADSILKQVNRLAAEEIATKIFGGGPGQQGGFGFGGFMSKLFSGVLGTGGAASGGAGLIDAFVGLASGGPARAGRPYLVGEEGPELFVPDTSGTVVPNGGSMGGGRIMVSNYFQVSGPIDRRSQDQIALAAGRGVNRAITRNG